MADEVRTDNIPKHVLLWEDKKLIKYKDWYKENFDTIKFEPRDTRDGKEFLDKFQNNLIPEYEAIRNKLPTWEQLEKPKPLTGINGFNHYHKGRLTKVKEAISYYDPFLHPSYFVRTKQGTDMLDKFRAAATVTMPICGFYCAYGDLMRSNLKNKFFIHASVWGGLARGLVAGAMVAGTFTFVSQGLVRFTGAENAFPHMAASFLSCRVLGLCIPKIRLAMRPVSFLSVLPTYAFFISYEKTKDKVLMNPVDFALSINEVNQKRSLERNYHGWETLKAMPMQENKHVKHMGG